MIGLWVTDVQEQTSRNGAVGHRFVGADITLMGLITCHSKSTLMYYM